MLDDKGVGTERFNAFGPNPLAGVDLYVAFTLYYPFGFASIPGKVSLLPKGGA